MKASIVFILFIGCITMALCRPQPRKYPETRNQCYFDTYYDYPLKRVDPVRYYMYNYNYPEQHEGHPYFGYPYGECNSCRLYQTEEVGVVKPDCPCKKLSVEY
ncbi:AGAP006549-PA-like protein [Anopheles sinensis]|uniref:AGAP006549-PA-like protein n=1 Tax=Anopheles sinensis TaxID=74873 RepID=A0A084WMP2_ANOSI|nr:AGAP006549-PA-like protein [Anopheles sinensis]